MSRPPRSYFGTQYADQADIARATIPVEKINGPVLLISGEDDALWPSTQLAQIAMDRLAQYQHPFPDKHLHYAGAGHLIGEPYLPTTALASYYNPTVEKTLNVGGKRRDMRLRLLIHGRRWCRFLQNSLRA